MIALILAILLILPSPAPLPAARASNAPADESVAGYSIGTVALGGAATWYCSDGRDGSPVSRCTRGYGPDSPIAAIDPTLDIPKGSRLTVTGAAGTVVVTVHDVCACKGSRIIDLPIGIFQRVVGPWSRGTGIVTIEYGGRIALPQTDTE